jgi:pheromone shutdown protein TraB
MAALHCLPRRLGDLELRIARLIGEQTWGFIRNLRIELRDERVILTGQATSYYVKQRALAAAQQALEAETLGWEVVPAIEVASAAGRPIEGRDRR